MKRPAAARPTAHAKPQQVTKQVDAWEAKSSQLKSWVEATGSWPRQHSDDATEKSLAKWMNNQRNARLGKALTDDRIATLESMPGWTWTPQADNWENVFCLLKTWVAEHGTLPYQHSADAMEASLADWLKKQRQARRTAALTAERIATLESMPGWTWTPQADTWETVFCLLKTWVAEHGALPTQHSDDATESSLAQWMTKQRLARMRGLLVEDHITILEQWPE
jgi:hypothetical protein